MCDGPSCLACNRVVVDSAGCGFIFVCVCENVSHTHPDFSSSRSTLLPLSEGSNRGGVSPGKREHSSSSRLLSSRDFTPFRERTAMSTGRSLRATLHGQRASSERLPLTALFRSQPPPAALCPPWLFGGYLTDPIFRSCLHWWCSPRSTRSRPSLWARGSPRAWDRSWEGLSEVGRLCSPSAAMIHQGG